MVNFATEMERQGFDDPAADRRRHHLPRAHRGQGRPEVPRPGRLGEGRVAVGARRGRAAVRRPAPASCSPTTKADYDSIRERHAAKHNDRRCCRSRRRAPTAARSTGSGYQPPAPRGRAAVTVLRGLRPGRAARLHRLAAVLQRLGDEGQVPRHPQQPGHGRGRAQAVRRRAGDARPDHRGEWLTGERACSGCSRPTRSATTSRSTPTSPAPRCSTTLHNLRQQGEHREGVPEPVARRLRRAQGDRPRRPRRRLRGDRRARRAGQDQGVQGRARRLLRDPARVARRPARRGVRRAAARAGAHASSGATRPTSSSTTRT